MKLNKILSLLEAAVGGRPEYQQLQLDDLITMLNTHCKDARWMIEQNNPIWRGRSTRSKAGATMFQVDPSKTMRKSQNTSNYYTMIWDHHPDWIGWPKRSQSFIGTSDLKYARDYGTAFAVIPYDGVKVGVVGRDDLHSVNVNIGPFWATYPAINRELERLGFPETSYDELVKYANGREYMEVKNAIDIRSAVAKIIGEAPTPTEGLRDLYSMSRMVTKPTLHTTKTLQSAPGWADGVEVWVSGPCVMISGTQFRQLRKSFANKN
jgi:hypothetical protein